MVKLTPAEGATKWRERLANNVQAVKDGIDRVTESPTEKAAKKEDKWIAGVQKAKASGKWVRGLRSVSLEQWKTRARDLGADRIPSGAAAAEGKMATFYGKLFPHEQKLQSKIAAMPDTSLEDSVARATAWIRGMAEFDSTK